jgi:predicted  nucleic acid-binding Zn-ribbon protein
MMSSNIYIYNFRADSQRDEALQNLLESQETLEDYQKKTQERIRKVRTKVNEYLHMK